MQYKIKGCYIKSQNAAKPHSQASKDVIFALRQMKGVNSILDLGCGKLRYSSYLNEVTENIYFSDSRIQLERKQMIKGSHCTVKAYVSHNYPSAKCVAVEDIGNVNARFDLIFCSNVLSAIPCEKTLAKTMSNIHSLLAEKGTALIVNQHRSSYFKKFTTGRKHLFGYLHEGRRGTSYYGIIDETAISKLASNSGLHCKVSTKGDRTFAYLEK